MPRPVVPVISQFNMPAFGFVSLRWNVKKRKGCGDKMQIYHMENCIAARELQTHRADLKNHGSGLGCRYIGMQIILLMTMAS